MVEVSGVFVVLEGSTVVVVAVVVVELGSSVVGEDMVEVSGVFVVLEGSTVVTSSSPRIPLVCRSSNGKSLTTSVKSSTVQA